MNATIDWKTLNTKYTDSEVQRDEIDQFRMIQRGSVRLCMNRVRTEAEQREFIQKGKSLALPRR